MFAAWCLRAAYSAADTGRLCCRKTRIKIIYKLWIEDTKNNRFPTRCRHCTGNLVVLVRLEKENGKETTYFSCPTCAQIEIKES